MQQKAYKSFTYQTRFFVNEEEDKMLSYEASLLSKVERHLYKDLYQKNIKINELKSSYLKRFNITARQFNSCRIKLEGKVSSCKELLNRNIDLLTEKIERLKKHISRLKDPHQKKKKIVFPGKQTEKTCK